MFVVLANNKVHGPFLTRASAEAWVDGPPSLPGAKITPVEPIETGPLGLFVVDPVPPGRQGLVTLWSNGTVEFATRELAWQTWGPPVWARQTE